MLRRRAELLAAGAVIAVSAAVAGAGIKLIRKHNHYVSEKAAAFFGKEDQDNEKGVDASDVA